MDPGSANHWLVKRYLEQAAVAIVVIDTPYLMEDDPSGTNHRQRHLEDTIPDLLKAHFFTSTTPKLLLLTPVRCEKYAGTPERDTALRQQVKQTYKPLMDANHRLHGSWPLRTSRDAQPPAPA